MILDLALPDGSGLELLPYLGSLDPATPVLIFSAHEVDARRRRPGRLGAGQVPDLEPRAAGADPLGAGALDRRASRSPAKEARRSPPPPGESSSGIESLEQALEPAGDAVTSGKPKVAPGPGERVGQAVEGARGLARPAGVAGGVAGRLDLGDAAGEPAGEIALQLAARPPDPQGCRERQIARTVSARVMGSNGLAITSAAPICR